MITDAVEFDLAAGRLASWLDHYLETVSFAPLLALGCRVKLLIIGHLERHKIDRRCLVRFVRKVVVGRRLGVAAPERDFLLVVPSSLFEGFGADGGNGGNTVLFTLQRVKLVVHHLDGQVRDQYEHDLQHGAHLFFLLAVYNTL